LRETKLSNSAAISDLICISCSPPYYQSSPPWVIRHNFGHLIIPERNGTTLTARSPNWIPKGRRLPYDATIDKARMAIYYRREHRIKVQPVSFAFSEQWKKWRQRSLSADAAFARHALISPPEFNTELDTSPHTFHYITMFVLVW